MSTVQPPMGLDRNQLETWFTIERGLADRLKGAPKEQRTRLYAELYDELFRRVPYHPQLQRRDSERIRALSVKRGLSLLGPLLSRNQVFLEIGAGDCSLSLAIAERVRKVYALDVSEEVMPREPLGGNVELMVSDGTSIPVPENSVDLAFSNQLMEHLHPDDAAEQLANIHRALRPGGRYLCITPNRISGPHDVTRYFPDSVARGFHLREYSSAELCDMLAHAGFRSTRLLIVYKGRLLGALPKPLSFRLEGLLEALPAFAGRPIARSNLMKPILGVRALAMK